MYNLAAQLHNKAVELNVSTLTAPEIGSNFCMFVSTVFTKDGSYMYYINPQITISDGVTYVDIKHRQCEKSTTREKYYMRYAIEYRDRKLNTLTDKCSTSKCRIDIPLAMNILAGTFECP